MQFVNTILFFKNENNNCVLVVMDVVSVINLFVLGCYRWFFKLLDCILLYYIVFG